MTAAVPALTADQVRAIVRAEVGILRAELGLPGCTSCVTCACLTDEATGRRPCVKTKPQTGMSDQRFRKALLDAADGGGDR